MATSGSLKVDGADIKVLADYDDLEDAIHEMHDDLWIMAGSVAASEPLQAKQQFEILQAKWDAIKAYVEAIPDPVTPKEE